MKRQSILRESCENAATGIGEVASIVVIRNRRVRGGALVATFSFHLRNVLSRRISIADALHLRSEGKIKLTRQFGVASEGFIASVKILQDHPSTDVLVRSVSGAARFLLKLLA